jgi:hypothetical protein
VVCTINFVFVKPSSQNHFFCQDDFCVVGIIDVDFFAIKYGDVSCLGKFCSADKQVGVNVGHNVDILCRLTDVMMEIAYM